jgi:cellulose synthase/poly-beta-1,6-N-acetylglucosamine synthase-like glycosyltransferase
MVSSFSIAILLMAVPVVVATVVLFVEVAAATKAERKFEHIADNTERPSVAVLVPAHNESGGLLQTLDDIFAQLNPGDSLLVVADNCTDDTADMARAAGAEVVERHNLAKIGKGYALDFGLRYLQEDASEVVIVIDADCRLGEGAINALAMACGLSGRPVQALYLMTSPKTAMQLHRLAEFAWRIKNNLRPSGLAALGLPCQLAGSGMAFPRSLIGAADLATGHLAEDVDLGLQFARLGHAPLFCPAALVTSEFPSTEQAAAVQRARWEHGHLAIIVTTSLPTIWKGLRSGNWELVALGLDVAVPPLILLGLLIILTFGLSLLVALVGGVVAPLAFSVAALSLFGLGVAIAWVQTGRDLLTPTALISIIPYIGRKFGVYARSFSSDKKWVRTDRTDPGPKVHASKPGPDLP